MTYNRHYLVERVEAQLTAEPGSQLFSLAENLGVERHTIETAVKGVTGLTFRDYRKRKRLQTGLHLLRKGQKSEKEIALRLGYSSSRAFGRFIKTNTGRTPTQIRRGIGRRASVGNRVHRKINERGPRIRDHHDKKLN